MTSCKDLLKAKKIEMTFCSIMESISHLGKMARTSDKSENPIGFNISNTSTQRCSRGSRGVNHLFSAYGQ